MTETNNSEQINNDDLYAIKDVNLYTVLCITKETFTVELEKKKYRKLVIKYHPDKNVDDPDCEDKYHMLQLAHHVLSNPDYKIMYDYIFESSANIEDYEDLKDVNRENPEINYMSEDEFYTKLRDLNLDADPNYYNVSDKITDDSLEAQTKRDNDINSLMCLENNEINNLKNDMKIKFQDDVNTLDNIENLEDRQKKFNEMFNMTADEDIDCEDMMLYNGNASMITGNVSSTTDYNTMFSGDRELNDVFKISKIGFSAEEKDEMNMSLEDQMKQYETLGEDLKLMSKKSTLKNGQADYGADYI